MPPSQVYVCAEVDTTVDVCPFVHRPSSRYTHLFGVFMKWSGVSWGEADPCWSDDVCSMRGEGRMTNVSRKSEISWIFSKYLDCPTLYLLTNFSIAPVCITLARDGKKEKWSITLRTRRVEIYPHRCLNDLIWHLLALRPAPSTLDATILARDLSAGGRSGTAIRFDEG